MPKISVIVPVYNAEKYLHRCIDSILAQTFSDFELLLIDDGSKDSSPAICDEYAEKDPRVRVFHKENGGVSSARNVGLDNVKGEWVTFVDADDWIERTAYADIISCTTNNDIEYIRFGYVKVHSDNTHDVHVTEKMLLTTHDDIYETTQSVGYFGFIWNSAFKRDNIGQLRYDETLSWAEDHVFSYKYLSTIHKAYFINRVLYNYFIQEKESLSFVCDPFMILKAGKEQHKALRQLDIQQKRNASVIESVYGHHLVLAIQTLYRNRYSFQTRSEFYKLCTLSLNDIPESLYLKIYKYLPFILVDNILRLRYFQDCNTIRK